MLVPNNSGYGYKSIISRFDPVQNSWTKLGYLQVARKGYSVIQVDNEFIVVGGADGYHSIYGILKELPTESCKINGQFMTCTMGKLRLSNFAYYPEMMLVS